MAFLLSFSIKIGHYIDERIKTMPIINFDAISNILAPSAGFFLEYISVFAFAIAFAYLLGRFLKTRGAFVSAFTLNLFTETLPIFKKCSKVGVFFTCNLLYIFLIRQMLANNVKTGEIR